MGDKLVSGEACGTDIAVVTDGNTFSIHADTDAVLKEKLLLLAQEGKRLEKLLNYPLDIEWAIVGEPSISYSAARLPVLQRFARDIFRSINSA